MAKDKHVTNAEKPVPTYAVVLPEHAGKARRGCAAPVEVAGAWVDAPDGPRGELAGASLGDDRALFAGDRDVLRFAPPLDLGARYTVAVVGAPFRDANPRKAGIARWMVATYGGASKDAHVCVLHEGGRQLLGVWARDEWFPCAPPCDLLDVAPRRADGLYEIVAHGAAGRTVFFVDGARVGAAAAAAAAEVDGAGNVPLPPKPGPSDRKQVFGALRRLEVHAGALVAPAACFRDLASLPPPPRRPKTAPKRKVVAEVAADDAAPPAKKPRAKREAAPKGAPAKAPRGAPAKGAAAKPPAAKADGAAAAKQPARKPAPAPRKPLRARDHGDCRKVLRSRVLAAHGEEAAFLAAADASPRGADVWVGYEPREPKSLGDLAALLRARPRDCVYKFRPGTWAVGDLGASLEAEGRRRGGAAVMEALRAASQMSTLFAPSGGGDDKSWRDLDKSSNSVDFGAFARAAARSDAAYAAGDETALRACIAAGAGANKVTEWKPSFLGGSRRIAPPPWFADASWLGKLAEKGKREVFKPKLALMQAGALTSQHRDNYGTVTWIKVLAGQQLLLTWSMADGDAADGLGDDGDHDADFPWAAFAELPSARLVLLDAGDFFLMRPGVYHRVFTLRPKVQLFGEFVAGPTFLDALASAAADAARPETLKARDKRITMRDILFAGLQAAAAGDPKLAAVADLKGDAALARLRWLDDGAAAALGAAASLDVDAACRRLLAHPGI